ncbi:MAG: fimbria/pilus outer membrane usher protein, partial [Sulfurimicrobium sp.]
EVHGEFVPGRQTLGFAATLLFPAAGVADAAIAGSRGDRGNGGLLALGFDRQTPRLSFGLRTQITSRQFDQLGLTAGTPAPLRQTSAHLGWNDARIGSFGLGYLRLDNRGQPGNEVLTASYSRNLGRDWFLGLSAFKSLGDTCDYALGLVLTHVLGQRASASLNASRRNGPDAALLQVQQNLPAGSGVGYRVLAGTEGSERFEGGLSMQNDYGTYALEAARFHGADAWRASASGALAVLGGQAFLSRRLGESFAVVRVPGYPGVQVYAENQPVARTDASGAALVPALRPYQKNRLAIEQNDLPLDARIDAIEVAAVPYYRSGYAVEFPVAKANGALLRITTEDGRPVPAGAMVRIDGREEVFAVARDGRAYVSGLERNNRMRVALPDARACKFEVSYPETDDPLPDLGSFVCREIKP